MAAFLFIIRKRFYTLISIVIRVSTSDAGYCLRLPDVRLELHEASFPVPVLKLFP